MPPDTRRQGFAPVADESTRVLVIGSMPGERSLQQAQYYAHPRNVFWKAAYAAFGGGEEPSARYEERLDLLLAHHVGLWDAAQSCERHASADSTIKSVVLNDFAPLFARCPMLKMVLCNGTTAHTLFCRATNGILPQGVRVKAMVSTSPAAAAVSPVDKLALWCAALTLDGSEGENR